MRSKVFNRSFKMDPAGWTGAVSLILLHLPLTPTALGSSTTLLQPGSCECHVHIHPVLPLSDSSYQKNIPSLRRNKCPSADHPYSSTDTQSLPMRKQSMEACRRRHGLHSEAVGDYSGMHAVPLLLYPDAHGRFFAARCSSAL